VSSPQPSVLREALLRRAAANSGSLAYTFGEEQLTFGELADRASARGCALQGRGIGHGDRVAIVMTPGPALLEVFWALQLIGAVPCIVNPAMPSGTVAHRVERVRPKVILTDTLADEIGAGRRALREPDVEAEDLAYLQLTSGTSGEPRAAMVTQRNVIAFVSARGGQGQIADDDVLVSWLPPWHDFGLVRFIITPVYNGVGCHLLEPTIRSIPEWLYTISRVRGTVTGGPDMAYRLAVRMADPARVDLASLRIASNGAEPVRWSTIERFEAHFDAPGRLLPGYGLAEATLSVAVHQPGEERIVDARGNVSCGRPIPGLEVRAGVDLDHPEEIRVQGDTVFAGYLDAPEDTARALRGDWLHTGDSGYLDDAGRLFVLGRRDGMLKRAGGVVAPRELEEAAEQVEGVRIAAAASVPPSGDSDPVIVVAVEARLDQFSAEAISAEVSRRVVAAVGFAPGRVVVVPPRTIPRTDNGKVRHGLLLAALGEDADGVGE